MLKLILRENMKNISRFLLVALALVSSDAVSAPVATTAGSNLTAYNPTSGSINNNVWNNFVNARSNSTANAPAADFGNCNALILRCAQPKCATGGCTTLEIARPIVSGCVESNESCKEYGEDLIEYISAQIVANSTAKANQQAADAQVAAAQAAAQQSAQQLQQMQAQMQQMQTQMQQQNAETTAQLQAALEEQKQLTAQAIAQANTNTAQPSTSASTSTTASNNSDSGGLTTAQSVAASSGVSADVIAREQISGQILSKIENAEVALKEVKAAMNTAFEYAGCDTTGNNCTGPKRVKTFKQKAMNFFDPYNNVLDELYDALILAQSVGVDITDIYMMLNGTCNVWGQYLCGPGQVMHYNGTNCVNGRSVSVTTAEGTVRGGAQCEVGQVVPMSDGGCQLIKMLTDEAEVQRNWLYPEMGTIEGVQVRVGCASEALDNSTLFRNRKKQASIDIEVLQRMIEQDAPAVFGGNRFGQNKSADPDGVKYCAVNATTFQDLQKYASLKQLPNKVCVRDDDLERLYTSDGKVAQGDTGASTQSVMMKCSALQGYNYLKCVCDNSLSKNSQWVPAKDAKNGEGECTCPGSGEYSTFDYERAMCVNSKGESAEDAKYFTYLDEGGFRKEFCEDYAADGAKWNSSSLTCDCSKISDSVKKSACEIMTAKESGSSVINTTEISRSWDYDKGLCESAGGTMIGDECMCGLKTLAYNMGYKCENGVIKNLFYSGNSTKLLEGLLK